MNPLTARPKKAHDGNASAGQAPVKVTPALMGATLVAAQGGLLFGFDTVVISGCQDQLKAL